MDLLRLKPAFKLPSKRPRIPMEPFPAYPCGKSRDEASGKTAFRKEASPQRRCGSRFHSTALLCRLRCFRPRGKRSLYQGHVVRANSEVGEADTDLEKEVVSEGECRDNAPISTPTALSNLIDPTSSHMLALSCAHQSSACTDREPSGSSVLQNRHHRPHIIPKAPPLRLLHVARF